jgi:hypothetical protein
MMHLMVDKFGIDEQRMGIVGFADTMPEAPNDTPEGRAKNRRVDIVIMNKLVLVPKKPGAPGEKQGEKPGAPAAQAAPAEKK